MGFFDRVSRMNRTAKKFAECQTGHPKAWALGIEIANEQFSERSDYLREQTRTDEGANKFARIVAEQCLKAVGEGRFEEEIGRPFPEPVTGGSATCLGISISKRLRDLFDEEMRRQ